MLSTTHSMPMKTRLTNSLLAMFTLFLGAAPSAKAFTAAEATDIWNSFNSAFYVGNGGNPSYLNIHGGTKLSLWQQAETIEMTCDREAVSGSSSDQAIITALCNGFVADFGSDWTGCTPFKEDVMG